MPAAPSFAALLTAPGNRVRAAVARYTAAVLGAGARQADGRARASTGPDVVSAEGKVTRAVRLVVRPWWLLFRPAPSPLLTCSSPLHSMRDKGLRENPGVGDSAAQREEARPAARREPRALAILVRRTVSLFHCASADPLAQTLVDSVRVLRSVRARRRAQLFGAQRCACPAFWHRVGARVVHLVRLSWSTRVCVRAATSLAALLTSPEQRIRAAAFLC